MSTTVRSLAVVRGVALVGLSVLAVSVYASKAGMALPEHLQLAAGSSSKTVLQASVEPGSLSVLVSEFPARASDVLAAAGEIVDEGDVLVVLENREITTQIEAAQKRLEAAAAHLAAARSPANAVRSRSLGREQMNRALRNRELARQRLEAFHVDDAEAALQAASERVKEVKPLLQRGLATEAELELHQRRQTEAQREVDTAHEHLSRLRKELDQAESEIRLLEIEEAAVPPSATSAEADYADAEAALTAAQERGKRLQIRAPARGTVLSLPVQPGEWILAGTPIAQVADLSTLTISAPVSAAVARTVQVGRPLEVLLPGEDRAPIPSRVAEVALVPDVHQHAYLIKVIIPNPDPEDVLVGLPAQLKVDHLDAL
jgi:multidrug efflux pump subunit AcrA (membrane-fusion protein)